MLSAANTTPYWESAPLSSLTSMAWPATADDSAYRNPAFGVWFKCLSDYATTNNQPLFQFMYSSSRIVQATLTAADTITFEFVEYTLPLFSGGTAYTTDTITFSDRTLDDGEWHFVGFAIYGGDVTTRANNIRLIADHYYKDNAGTADTILLTKESTLRLGRATSDYAEHIEYAEPTFYEDNTSTGGVKQLAWHWQFAPLQALDTTSMYGEYIKCQWKMEPAFIAGRLLRGTYGMDMVWQGAIGFESTVQQTWYRNKVIGDLHDRKVDLAVQPKSWAWHLGNNMKFAASSLISGWTSTIVTELPQLSSYNLTSGTWLDIPSTEKVGWMDNARLGSSAMLLKRHS